MHIVIRLAVVLSLISQECNSDIVLVQTNMLFQNLNNSQTKGAPFHAIVLFYSLVLKVKNIVKDFDGTFF